MGHVKIPETDLGLLADVKGADVVELGCGTGYISSWIARLGGRTVGVDPTRNQLASARGFQNEFDVSFPVDSRRRRAGAAARRVLSNGTIMMLCVPDDSD